eukprot:1161279-Pelagomonas_calceolata.AAC.1
MYNRRASTGHRRASSRAMHACAHLCVWEEGKVPGDVPVFSTAGQAKTASPSPVVDLLSPCMCHTHQSNCSVLKLGERLPWAINTYLQVEVAGKLAGVHPSLHPPAFMMRMQNDCNGLTVCVCDRCKNRIKGQTESSTTGQGMQVYKIHVHTLSEGGYCRKQLHHVLNL